MNPKYFESHITIEPVFGDRLVVFETLCKEKNFKAAKLLMQKDRKETGERSNKDSFCTGHGKTYDELYCRMDALKNLLIENGFEVWRCKIESILFDEKYERKPKPKTFFYNAHYYFGPKDEQ
jgi:hypothetical protein